MRTRYIPTGSSAIEHPQGLGIVYTYIDGKGRPCAVAYAGKQSNCTWHHLFFDEDNRNAKIAEFWASLESWRRTKAERAAERTQPHSLQVGDIIYNSWGYDQTNVDFYVVVKRSDNYVWLHPIAQETTETGFMCGKTKPAKPLRLCSKKLADGSYAEPEQHRVYRSTYGDSVNFEFGSGSKWNGEEVGNSWYA